MTQQFAPLSHVPLERGSAIVRPSEIPGRVRMDSPAIEVMTDFKVVWAVTTSPDVSVDVALEAMKREGVRLLLVTGDDETVIGIVTATDILGDKPIRVARESGVARASLTVAHIMTPQSAIEVLNLVSIRNAQVGHVVATLHALERQHALVVEVDQKTRRQRVRGLFSTSQVSKQLGRDVSEVMSAAHSLAEIQHQMGPAQEDSNLP